MTNTHSRFSFGSGTPHFLTHKMRNRDRAHFILAVIALRGSLVFWSENLVLSWMESKSAPDDLL